MSKSDDSGAAVIQSLVDAIKCQTEAIKSLIAALKSMDERLELDRAMYRQWYEENVHYQRQVR
jgi:hypothetical protein